MKHNFDEVINRNGTNSFKYDFREPYFGTEDILPMWVADMDFKTPDFIMKAINERAKHPVLGYSLKPESYYNSIISWLNRRHNWQINRNWISFSPGVVPALTMSVLAFTEPGDKIIVQPPVYFPFFTTINGPGRTLVNNPLQLKNGRYYMDFHDLKRKIDTRTKMIFLCSPHNPGGMVWQKDELEELANICLEHDILIISDEIHADLVFKNYKQIPIASISEDIANNVITCMAPSKTFNVAALSTSYVIISNPTLMKKYNKTLDFMHLQIGNVFGNTALESAYKNGDSWLEQMLSYVEDNVEFVMDFLEEKIPKIKAIKPEGTYLIWLDCRELGMTNSELKEFMIKKAKVGLNDGPTFGEGGEGFQRMNLACPKSIVADAMHRIEKAVNKL